MMRSSWQRYKPRLWFIFCAVLALYMLHASETSIQPNLSAQAALGATPSLEPILIPSGGYYEQDVQVRIRNPNSSTSVVFTVDGSTPSHTNGAVYTRPIHLHAATPAVTVIRARAILPDGELGPIINASYYVGVPAELPMLSLIIDPDDLWDPARGLYTNPEEKGITWERPAYVTYVDKDRRSEFHIPAGVRIHGGGSRSCDKKALRLYFRQEYGASRLEYPLFADSEVRSFKRLVLHNGGQDMPICDPTNTHFCDPMHWTLIRNQLVDRLAQQIGGYTTHSQPTLLFINGESWGIYQIRERTDRFFLLDQYGITSADFLQEPEMPGRNIMMGGIEEWDHLMQFIEARDLADPDNYAYVQSQVNIANFIDYSIIHIYAANADWPRQNIRLFRPHVQGGRWRWMFWDSDSSFAAYPVCPCSDVDLDMIRQVLDFRFHRSGGRDTLLLRKLLENPTFLDQFLRRTADLLNTTLAPDSVETHIDTLATEIEPDIAYETIRWSSLADWKSSLEELYDFARRRPDALRRHVIDRLDLAGTARLTFNPPPSGVGYVAVNEAPVYDLPWQGIYFQGLPVQIAAVPGPGYRFAGWDPPDLSQTPAITLIVSVEQTLTPRFEKIDTHTPQPGDVVFTAHQSREIDQSRSTQRDWFELLVTRSEGVDLRGWRVTDNDTKTATDEGSLFFSDNPAFAHVPRGTTILVIVPRADDAPPPRDDLDTWDRRIVLYAGNPNLDIDTDPGFHLGLKDNLVLLAPGLTQAFRDDQGIAFVSDSTAVTPATFGVLTDGILSPQMARTMNDRQDSSNQQAPDQIPTQVFILTGCAALGLASLYRYDISQH
jgi:hypothetical protein